jgi:hypothetical protein
MLEVRKGLPRTRAIASAVVCNLPVETQYDTTEVALAAMYAAPGMAGSPEAAVTLLLACRWAATPSLIYHGIEREVLRACCRSQV